MHLRFRHWITVFLLSALVVPAQATRYTIETTADTISADGQCSLREAFQAINTQSAVNECEAGDGRDRIMLQQGKVYNLDGELTLGGDVNGDGFDTSGGQDLDGDGEPEPRDANPQVRIFLNDTDAEQKNAVLDMGGNSRAFTVYENSELLLVGITLRNGNAIGTTHNGHGGLVYVEGGGLELRTEAKLVNGSANRGGLVYAQEINGKSVNLEFRNRTELVNGTAEGDGGALYMDGRVELALAAAAVRDSVARGTWGTDAGNGGGIAAGPSFESPTFQPFELNDSYVADNHAAGSAGQGGGIFLQGAVYRVISRNTSIIGNRAEAGAGGFHISAPGDVASSGMLMNNVTIANNFSGANGSLFVGSADSDFTIQNSVIVGDESTNDDCDSDGTTGDSDDLASLNLEYNVLGYGCYSSGNFTVDATNGGTTQSMAVLANKQVLQSGNQYCNIGCPPVADLEPFPGYLPAPEAAPTAYHSANPADEGANSCETRDQRGVSRLEQDRCDAGAIQFDTAVGQAVEKEIFSGEVTRLDVVESDLGDSGVNCARTDVVNNPLSPVLANQQTGVPEIDDCVQLLSETDRSKASVRFILVDKDNDDTTGFTINGEPGLEYPVAVYNPGTDYHGRDRFAYRVNRHAFDATKQDRNVEAVTSVLAEPKSGLTESDSIDHIGASSGLGLLVIAIMGLIRRRALAVLALLFLAPWAQAAQIEVTTLADDAITGDGECTLREAIYAARDNTYNPEQACEDGSGGRDTVLVPRGCITLRPDAPELGPLPEVDDPLTIRGKGVHGVDPTQGLDGSECSPNDESNPDWTEGTIIRVASSGDADGDGVPNQVENSDGTDPNNASDFVDANPANGVPDYVENSATRIFENSSGLVLQGLSLMYAATAGDGGAIRASADVTLNRVEFFQNYAQGSGGAVYLVGIDGDQQETEIRRSYFLDNHAGSHGGGVGMQATNHSLLAFDNTFEGNAAGITGAGTGGGIRMAATKGISWINNTTFYNNTAASGAGGLDLQAVTEDPNSANPATPAVNMVNNTIVGNTGGVAGGIDIGVQRLGSDNDRLHNIRMNNSIVAANSGNECSSAGTAASFEQLVYNILSENSLQSSGGDCFSDNDQEGNEDSVPDSDIQSSLSSSTLYTDGGEADGFVPPNLEILDGQAATADLQNSGNPDVLAASETEAAARCRRFDVRGFTRGSGGRCDRGAFEVQQTTGQVDVAKNQPRFGGKVYVNVLKNDSTDPTKYVLDPETINPDPASVPLLPRSNPRNASANKPGIAVVYGAFPDIQCGDTQALQEASEENPDVRYNEDYPACFVLFNAAYTDPIEENPDSANYIECGDLPLRFKPANLGTAFSYEFKAYDEDAGVYETYSTLPNAQGIITINNVAPVIRRKEVMNKPGEKVVLNLNIRDRFGPETGNSRIDYSSMTLATDPEFADRDDNGEIVGTGIKFNEPSPGMVTYIPRDKTKRFTDRFRVEVSDHCGESSSGGQIVIRYPEENASGGDLLGSGGLGGGVLFGLIGLGALRRRLSRPLKAPQGAP